METDPNELREEQAEVFALSSKIKKLIAKDAMIKPVFLDQDDDCETVLEKLKKEHIVACIVIDKKKRFVGEISDNDIIGFFMQQTRFEPLVKILNRGYRREFLYKTAKDVANKHKHTVNLDTPINKVIMFVDKKGFEYVPVVDKNEKVVGVVTPSSLINLLQEY